MSGAQYGERGGPAAMRATFTLPDQEAPTMMQDSTHSPSNTNASSSLKSYNSPQPADSTTALASLPTDARKFAIDSTNNRLAARGKLAFSPQESLARTELLRESVFPDWEDDASSAAIDNPDEMQKKDPLATQIWKLYSKTKSQLPNQERMENLTWRMMAMSLKRKEREQARYVKHRVEVYLSVGVPYSSCCVTSD